jgi:branched-chain amino acid transport system ATP-binding protein
MLQLECVSAAYGECVVLWDVSLDVFRGEAVALLGRNGMGKTTTLRTIMGLTPTRSGRITFKNEALAGLRPFEIARRGVGYAPEGRQVFATLSVLENLRIPFVTKHPDKRRWSAQVERVFAMFPSLAGRRTQFAGSLSGGEQQMLAISRAMMGGDELLILDEPTEGLSPQIVEVITTALRALKGDGLSVLLVEQNLKVALGIADRAFVLEKGRVALTGTTEQLTGDGSLLYRYLGVDIGV